MPAHIILYRSTVTVTVSVSRSHKGPVTYITQLNNDAADTRVINDNRQTVTITLAGYDSVVRMLPMYVSMLPTAEPFHTVSHN